MEVRTNKIGDIRSHYRLKLAQLYNDREADTLLFQLLSDITQMSKAHILSFPEKTISESELLRVHFGVKDLLKNKPIQYIIGNAEFYGLNFKVNSKVLIPRPETEELVEMVIKNIPENEPRKVLDVGTGSGCIAIAIKKLRPLCDILAIDISEFALEMAQQNAVLNNVQVQFKKVDFLKKNQVQLLPKFDIVVSNPPYVRNSEKLMMKKNVLDYEPLLALFVDDDNPLIFYEALASFCETNLQAGGMLFAEINQYLSAETEQLFTGNGFKNVNIEKDLFGNDRFLTVLT
ncbi:MAG TPA: peptide chain release factor N(5)-glutamine methyltransferase [Bacteroidales bacterium]|nr:peptide chain release factor N(5)-glutamine methyltransferase [Bacteroidales bacterium]HPE57001.1 peptide chain release factor N(5)-glutamine methyltransferase [Bacteroidales bacterium]HRX96037.1 peptide chain release factor N(5)-glutamine methyltransferase [Bacteroidales bacterium]